MSLACKPHGGWTSGQLQWKMLLPLIANSLVHLEQLGLQGEVCNEVGVISIDYYDCANIQRKSGPVVYIDHEKHTLLHSRNLMMTCTLYHMQQCCLRTLIIYEGSCEKYYYCNIVFFCSTNRCCYFYDGISSVKLKLCVYTKSDLPPSEHPSLVNSVYRCTILCTHLEH